jgi:hypothetical protein
MNGFKISVLIRKWINVNDGRIFQDINPQFIHEIHVISLHEQGVL